MNNRDTIQRIKEIGWYIENNNETKAKDAEHFLSRRKTKSYSSYFHCSDPIIALDYYKSNTHNNKIAQIGIKAYLDENNIEYFRFVICSNSKNQEIYTNFKEFFESLNWKNSTGDYGCDSWIGYTSNDLVSIAEVQKTIQLIEKYDALPALIKLQLRVAIGLSAANTEEIIITLKEKGYEDAIKFVPPSNALPQQYNDAMLLIGDTCFDNDDLEHAIMAYKCISKFDLGIYQKAQYQIGSIIFTRTDSNDYDSVRHHAKACLSYYLEAGDFKDSLTLCNVIFNCLCNGSYHEFQQNIPCPLGAKPEVVTQLADLLYSNQQREKQLLEENQKLKLKMNELVNKQKAEMDVENKQSSGLSFLKF